MLGEGHTGDNLDAQTALSRLRSPSPSHTRDDARVGRTLNNSPGQILTATPFRSIQVLGSDLPNTAVPSGLLNLRGGRAIMAG